MKVEMLISKRLTVLNKGEPSSKAKYDITSDSELVPWGKWYELVVL